MNTQQLSEHEHFALPIEQSLALQSVAETCLVDLAWATNLSELEIRF
jgi:hypothetical protein